jgi:hypothetical protein
MRRVEPHYRQKRCCHVVDYQDAARIQSLPAVLMPSPASSVLAGGVHKVILVISKLTQD